jgi:exportin-1
MQAVLLARLISLVETNAVSAPLYDPTTVPDPSISNADFLKSYISDLLCNAFTNVQPAQIAHFVNLLFNHSPDPVKFKFTLRDFLISLKEFTGDHAELYIEEKEAEAEKKTKEEREMAMRVPGMIKPSMLDDDGDL